MEGVLNSQTITLLLLLRGLKGIDRTVILTVNGMLSSVSVSIFYIFHYLFQGSLRTGENISTWLQVGVKI